ncbi:MAG: response regulator transcription factor [Candidatus Nanopelagicales bacterium]
MAGRVLVVDDEIETRVLVRYCLEQEGFDVEEASDGDTALEFVRRGDIHLVILDVGIGQPNGIEVCRRMREASDLPILLLTGRDSETDELIGFASGASDYITKPFRPNVLVARVSMHLERSKPGREGEGSSPILRFSNIELDLASRQAMVDGAELSLTRTEFDLLALLLSQPTRVFHRAEILDEVWGASWFGSEHQLETHLSRLRGKIRASNGPEIAVAVRGVGYRLGDLSAAGS